MSAGEGTSVWATIHDGTHTLLQTIGPIIVAARGRRSHLRIRWLVIGAMTFAARAEAQTTRSISFDELPMQPIDGLVFNGVRFGFTEIASHRSTPTSATMGRG